jgi:hypothetical protein
LRMRGNCTPVAVQCAGYLLVAACADTRSHQYHQVIAAKQCLLQAETFADHAFYPVAFDRVAGSPDRYYRAEPGVIQTVGGGQHRDQAVTCLVLAMFKNPLVLDGREQAAAAWITRRHGPGERRSDRQASATFGSACLDDKTAILGAHPGTKTVGALALQVTGLKCSLHGAIDSQKQLKARCWAGRIRPRRLLVLPGRCQPLRRPKPGALVVDNCAAAR